MYLSFLLSGSISAREVTVGMGLSIAPYIISDTNTGIEYDIIASALEAVGHTLKPRYLPLARVKLMLFEKKVDGATPLKPDLAQNICYSDSHIRYQNVAVALKDSGYAIKHVRDLAGMRILAFQNAPIYLGDEFGAVVKGSEHYREDPNQSRQVHALFGNYTDVIVLDKNIFYYYFNLSKRRQDFKSYTMYHIFPPSIYSVGFTDRKLCADFNKGLALIQRNKVYSDIVKRYTLH